ncbi:MAG TPA: hypothetical protein VIT23_11785 [Terrimicrobiaceae bacterium]
MRRRHINAAHNVVHLIRGAVELLAALDGMWASQLFFEVFGIIYRLVAILRFLAGDRLDSSAGIHFDGSRRLTTVFYGVGSEIRAGKRNALVRLGRNDVDIFGLYSAEDFLAFVKIELLLTVICQ